MNPQVAVPLVVLIAMAVALLLRWIGHRERMARIAADAARPPEDAARLARLEQAVEAIALETERIGEGQRYVTRLLAERAPLPASRAHPHDRADTPH